MEPWNKGLTKDNNKKLAKIARQKSKWWKENDTSETRRKIGIASKKNTLLKLKGDKHPNWKGGRYKDSRDGYIFLYRPNHPNARSDGNVLEHRFIMSELIGRPLESDEDVNHLNGKKDDNRPENLRLVRHFAHYEEHKCPRCEFKFLTR